MKNGGEGKGQRKVMEKVKKGVKKREGGKITEERKK